MAGRTVNDSTDSGNGMAAGSVERFKEGHLYRVDYLSLGVMARVTGVARKGVLSVRWIIEGMGSDAGCFVVLDPATKKVLSIDHLYRCCDIGGELFHKHGGDSNG